MSLETFERLPAEKSELILSAGIGAFSRKAYKEVRTDDIAKQCGISKGILFHYFGSKKAFYLYCLTCSLERLTANTGDYKEDDFYGILFAAMDRKLSLCRAWREETHMVNMASRDPSGEIAAEKAELLRQYMLEIRAESARTLNLALAALKLGEAGAERRVFEGLQLYVNALLNKYLLEYRQTPDLFFQNSEMIRAEMKAYLDLMLYGICGKEQL